MICVTQYLLRKQISGICADNTALTSKYNKLCFEMGFHYNLS